MKIRQEIIVLSFISVFIAASANTAFAAVNPIELQARATKIAKRVATNIAHKGAFQPLSRAFYLGKRVSRNIRLHSNIDKNGVNSQATAP